VRLRQVLINLVGNALKFTQQGEVPILAELSAKTDSSMLFHFTIADTGIGIALDSSARYLKRLHKRICPLPDAMVAPGWDCQSLSGW